MTIHIAFGWWLLPLAVTVASFVLAMKLANEPDGLYGGGAMWNFVVWVFSLVPILTAWLIWAVLT